MGSGTIIVGVLRINGEKGIYIDVKERAKRIFIKAGQYLYMNIYNCWIPVIVQYSEKMHRWFFKNLEGVNVAGKKVMIK
jgi:hypothetical protein